MDNPGPDITFPGRGYFAHCHVARGVRPMHVLQCSGRREELESAHQLIPHARLLLGFYRDHPFSVKRRPRCSAHTQQPPTNSLWANAGLHYVFSRLNRNGVETRNFAVAPVSRVKL